MALCGLTMSSSPILFTPLEDLGWFKDDMLSVFIWVQIEQKINQEAQNIALTLKPLATGGNGVTDPLLVLNRSFDVGGW